MAVSICAASRSNVQPRKPNFTVAHPAQNTDASKPRHARHGLSLSLSLVGLVASLALPCSAADVRKVGEFDASGLIFKDSVEVVAVDDPVVSGVTLYVSDFKRSLADKVASLDFVNEPSQSSVTCAATGPISLPDSGSLGGSEGKQVFSETKSRALFLFGNKTLRIRRIYDDAKKTLTYVSYSTRIGSAGEEGNTGTSRYRTSICVVPIPNTTFPTTTLEQANKTLIGVP